MLARSFVLDASVLVAAALPNEPFHADASRLMKRLMNDGAFICFPAAESAERASNPVGKQSQRHWS